MLSAYANKTEKDNQICTVGNKKQQQTKKRVGSSIHVSHCRLSVEALHYSFPIDFCFVFSQFCFFFPSVPLWERAGKFSGFDAPSFGFLGRLSLRFFFFHWRKYETFYCVETKSK